MRTLIHRLLVIILISVLIIVIFFIVSSVLKTEKPGFIAASVFSFLTLGFVASRYPGAKWYMPVIIYLPILILLIIAYQGEGMKFYLTSILICVLITYSGSFCGAFLASRKKNGFSRVLKTGVPGAIVSIIILLFLYLAERYAKLDKPLIAVLETIFEADQDFIKENKRWELNSPEWKAWNKKWEEIDSTNLLKVADIINLYGWPGEDIIGWQGSSTLWVVIQHTTLENQEKFLPLMREAVKKGKARPAQLALLEDRILVQKGEEQIYGTQAGTDSLGIYKIWPIKDERNVNKRRFSVGLGPLQWYVKKIGLTYSLPE
jgi:energy-coupling factor transporter transmembrane protein EcfT